MKSEIIATFCSAGPCSQSEIVDLFQFRIRTILGVVLLDELGLTIEERCRIFSCILEDLQETVHIVPTEKQLFVAHALHGPTHVTDSGENGKLR